VRDTMQLVITSAGREILTLFGLIVVMFIQDARLALIALAGLPVAAFLLSRAVGRIRKFVIRGYAGATQIMQIMQETVQGGRIVKSFNLENEMHPSEKVETQFYRGPTFLNVLVKIPARDADHGQDHEDPRTDGLEHG
jgi:ATP-binding cassette subfamily B protein